MYERRESVFYYFTVGNESYPQPKMPEGAAPGILRGMYLFKAGARAEKKTPRVQLMGSGAILREVIAAADLLRNHWGVESDLWSCPSFTELARDGRAVERENMLHPAAPPRRSYVESCLAEMQGPVIASTDYVRAYPEQIRPYVGRRYLVLGTDGFGRSDTREQLRRFFEVDRHHVAVAALHALAKEGTIPAARVSEALARYGIDPSKPAPWTV